MSFLKDFKSSFSGEQETPQEVEMNPLEDVWSNMKATASSAIDSAKKTTTKFKNTAVPTSEEDGTLESAWSKMTKQATAAAKSAKKSVAPMAATAGINLTINEDEKNEGDEENLMSGASDAANGLSEEMNGICPALTYKQRIYGALGCIGLGLLLDVFASLAFWMGKAHVTDYAVLYTLGNMTAICGSGFIVGPMKQSRMMCKPVRRIACTVYLSTMVATILVAILYPDVLLIFSLIIIQYCALIWYGASFIPFGRSCLVKGMKVCGKAMKKGMGIDE